MQVDYTGAASINALIEHTGLTKFVISRVGVHKNSVPVFEHLERGTAEKAINAFSRWAAISDNCLPYEMELFNDVDDLTEETTKTKKNRGKSLKFTFCLNKEQGYQPQPSQSSVNVSEAIENALLKMQMKNNESELLKRLEALDEKVNNALLEDEDEEDDTEALSGLNSPAITSLLGMLAKALNQKPSSVPAVNGINDSQKANISKAINTLAKYDEQIDQDLLKLAAMAENNNSMFNMLLNSLRSM